MLKAMIVATMLMLPTTSFAVTTLVLKIDGVPGESTIDKHTAEIDVVSFGWGAAPTDARRPVVCPTEFTVNKFFDAASPSLALAALTKQPFAEVTLFALNPDQDAYLTITMRNARVSRYQTGGAESDARPLESLGFSFSEITGTYAPSQAGTPTPPRSFTYQSTKPCLPK